MEQNDQNRNYTISSKVSSSQKAKYIQEAKRLNLSLSEWMCGTLDMSINAYSNVNNTEQVEQLKEKNRDYVNMIHNLNSWVNFYKSYYDNNKAQVSEEVETSVVYIRSKRR